MPKIKTIGTIHDTLTGYDFEVDAALRPLKAIRTKCLECCNASSLAVKQCTITDCALWPYRLGKRPVRALTPHGRNDFETIGTQVGVE